MTTMTTTAHHHLLAEGENSKLAVAKTECLKGSGSKPV